jgi:hypothetical protein
MEVMMLSSANEYKSKEFEAVMTVAEQLYGDLPAKVWHSIWECWVGRETEKDIAIIEEYNIRTLEIGRQLYQRGFFDE